jgi:hypothetical protein
MKKTPGLKVTVPFIADDKIIEDALIEQQLKQRSLLHGR